MYVPAFNLKGAIYLADPDGNFFQSAFVDMLAPSLVDSARVQSHDVRADEADAPDTEDGLDTCVAWRIVEVPQPSLDHYGLWLLSAFMSRFPATARLASDGAILSVKSPQLRVRNSLCEKTICVSQVLSYCSLRRYLFAMRCVLFRYAQGGEVQFKLYSTVHVELTCTFSLKSPRPSQIKIRLLSCKAKGTAESIEGFGSESVSHESASPIDDGGVEASANHRGTGDMQDNERQEKSSIYSALHRALERVKCEGAEEQKAADSTETDVHGTTTTTVTTATAVPSQGKIHGAKKNPADKLASKSPLHPKAILGGLGHVRFGTVAQQKMRVQSRESASLGRISYHSGHSNRQHSLSSYTRAGGGGNKNNTSSASRVLEAASRNPMGKQAGKLKKIERQAMDRARKLLKKKGKSARFG